MHVLVVFIKITWFFEVILKILFDLLLINLMRFFTTDENFSSFLLWLNILLGSNFFPFHLYFDFMNLIIGLELLLWSSIRLLILTRLSFHRSWCFYHAHRLIERIISVFLFFYWFLSLAEAIGLCVFQIAIDRFLGIFLLFGLFWFRDNSWWFI